MLNSILAPVTFQGREKNGKVTIFFPENRFGAQKTGKPKKRKMLIPLFDGRIIQQKVVATLVDTKISFRSGENELKPDHNLSSLKITGLASTVQQ